MNKYKRYSLITIFTTLFLIFFVMFYTYITDPLFHYHSPNLHFKLSIHNERYQNDGILRHFDYDAIITGTSMTENFKTSEFDKLFNVKSVKVPFSGGSYKEINDNLKRAVKYNKNIKYVIRSLDMSMFFTDKNYMRYDVDNLDYLIDDNYFNDIKYLFNKSIFFEYVPFKFHMEPVKLYSFDIAYNWNDQFEFGENAILKNYKRSDLVKDEVEIKAEEIYTFQENIDLNIISVIKENPDIEFYYFLTPYSILFWDEYIRTKTLNKHLVGERMIIESLIKYPNVHLFSFNDDFELITSLDNYKDAGHYGENVNSYILQNMINHTHELNKNNYKEYLIRINEYYENYDYDKIFEK